jgi:hypothetical protein
MLHQKIKAMKIFSPCSIICLLMFAGSINMISAQTHQDIIFLNNGNEFHGRIIFQSEQQIKIEIAGGSVFVILKSEIDSIKYSAKSINRDKQFTIEKSGYYNVTQIGIPMGTQSDTYYYSNGTMLTAGFNAQTINGYRFYSHFLAGVGTGIDIIQHPMLQLFGDFRYELLRQQFTPFLYADAGYGFDLAGDYNTIYQSATYTGGEMLAIGTGLRFNFNGNGAFLFDIGYRVSKRKETIHYEGAYDLTNEYTMNRILIKFGVAF